MAHLKPRRAQSGTRPSHPSGTAFLLIAGVTVAIIALAVVTTFGLG